MSRFSLTLLICLIFCLPTPSLILAQTDATTVRWVGIGFGVYDQVKYPYDENELYEGAILDLTTNVDGSLSGSLSWFYKDQVYQMSIQGTAYTEQSQIPNSQEWDVFNEFTDIVEWQAWTITRSPNEPAYQGLQLYAVIHQGVLGGYFKEPLSAFGEDFVAVGIIMYHPKELTVSNLAGTWTGSLRQGGIQDFDFTMTFDAESEQTFSGTSEIGLDSASGVMQLQARIIDNGLVFKERGILEQDLTNGAVHGWCIKTGTLYLVTGSNGGDILTGRWNAPNCVAGAIYLAKE